MTRTTCREQFLSFLSSETGGHDCLIVPLRILSAAGGFKAIVENCVVDPTAERRQVGPATDT